MPVITLSSPKGGSGKTTAATLIATELAEHGATVTVIDADPNRNVLDWSRLPDKPHNLTVISDVTEETITERIDEASEVSSFVIVDLEGTASLMTSYTIAMSDFVIIPVQGSQLDAKQAARQIKLIKQQERLVGRAIPFAVLFTRTNPALNPKTQRHIEANFKEHAVPMFQTQLYDREAFRAVFSFGGSIRSLKGKGVSNLETAQSNASAFMAELVERLRNGNQTPSVKEVA